MVNNSGSIRAEDNGIVRVNTGVTVNGGQLETAGNGRIRGNNTSGGTLQARDGATLSFTARVFGPNPAGSIQNADGILRVCAGTTALLNFAITLNSGTLEALGGGTLSGLTIRLLNGSLSLPANVVTTEAALVISGAGSTCAQLQTLATNNGAIEIADGRTFAPTAPFSNQGYLHPARGRRKTEMERDFTNQFHKNLPSGRLIA